MSIINNNEGNNLGPAKVFLWATPRSISTAFLKCLTYVPDSVMWYEPFHELTRVGNDKEAIVAEPLEKLVEEMGGKEALDKIEGGFDSTNTSFDWLKEQLEGDYSDKKLVFAKDISVFVSAFGRFDKIPAGFRHTFIIRHPIKTAMSLMKIKHHREGVEDVIDTLQGQALPFKASYDLYEYIKQNLDPNPLIIDADDLLANPAGMLKAYCNKVHIPYSDDLLHWEGGDDVMSTKWMVPKETILTFREFGTNDAVFAKDNTGFKKPSGDGAELPSLDELSGQFPEELVQLAGMEMPFYEKLYEKRLKL